MKQRDYQMKTDSHGNLFKTYYHDKPRMRGKYVFWKRVGESDYFRHPTKKRPPRIFRRARP